MERAKLLNAIIENAIDGIITIDEFGIIEHINPSALALFGYDREEITGKNVSMLMPQPDKAKHDQYIANYRHSGHAHIIGIGREVQGQRKDGSVFPFRLGVSEV
ncbi:MAG: PAS domain S-box protein, partial [Pedobacter sp.]